MTNGGKISQACSVPDRRTFLQGGLAAAVAMIAPASAASATEKPREAIKRPNLLFIYTEGQRSDALSIAGHPLLKTPHQDRIGREGIRFQNAFCTNALCAPARATVLTGLYSKTTGALDNKLLSTPLPLNIPIFTDLLHEAGYETAIVGKVHTRNAVKERYWDYYFGFNAPSTNYYRPMFAEGRKGDTGEEKMYHGYADDIVTEKALGWLREPREKPFCLLLWYQTPHAPFYRPRKYLDLYNGVPIPKPATFDDDLKGWPGKPKAFVDAENKIGTLQTVDGVRSLEELCKDYYAGIVSMDDNIGRVFQHLDGTGQMKDTAVVHSSDHGFFLGEFRMYDKRFMHEPSIRVPLMIRYPEHIKPGIVRQEMVLDIDIAPTILEIAGIAAPAHMQGKSLLKLADSPDPQFRKEWLYDYYEFPGSEQVRPHRGVRTDTEKYIHYYLEPQEFEMYDLAIDPGETKNLYGNPAHSAMQQRLAATLERLCDAIPQHRPIQSTTSS